MKTGGLMFGLLDLALTIFTAGIWLVLWLIVGVLSVLLPRRSPWTCPNCGRRV